MNNTYTINPSFHFLDRLNKMSRRDKPPTLLKTVIKFILSIFSIKISKVL